MDAFLDAVCFELTQRITNPPFGGFSFSSLYFGGGTPSLLRVSEIETIITPLVRENLLNGNAEITVEINPATVDGDWYRSLRSLGFNRMSIGIQSFCDRELHLLGRLHSADAARSAFREARRAGFSNINIDLLFGISGQTQQSLQRTLTFAGELDPEHISLYGLTIEKNTVLAEKIATGALRAPEAEEEREMYLRAVDFLSSIGYSQYEISNYAKTGYECAHNINYWRRYPYLGLGPSAFSFCNNVRSWNVRSITQYITHIDGGRLPVASFETLDAAQRLLETVFLSLRMNEGLTISALNDEFGIDFLEAHGELLQGLFQENLAVYEEGNLRLTRQGFLLYDEICRLFA